MITFIILFIISILLELIIPNLFKDVFPLFSVGVILLGANIKGKNYYMILLFSGVITSIVFSPSIILYCILYLLIGFTAKLIINENMNFVRYTLTYILLSYLFLLLLFIYTCFFNKITLLNLIKLFISNLLINLIYFILSYIVYFVIRRKNNHIGKIGDFNDYKR